MGALEDLALALLGGEAQKTIAAENPYYQFQAVPQAFQAGAMQFKPTNSRDMWQQSLAGSAGGLLSGILQGAGNSYQNTLTDRYTNALAQSLLGQEPSAEGLSPGLFGAAKRGGTLFRGVNAAQMQGLRNVSKADLEHQEQLIDIAARKRLAEIVAEDQAWKMGQESAQAPGPKALILPEGNPNNPYYKDEKETVTRLQDLSKDLRKEFNALPEVKNFSIVEKGAGVMAKALKDPSSVADQELVRYAILMIEPGMAVREGEQNAVAASQSIPEKWKGELTKALTGGAALGPEIRAGLQRLAARSYEGNKAQYDRTLAFYTERAKEVGLDPSALSYIGASPTVDAVVGPRIPDVPPGYKLQQNSRTGEYRVVPK